MSKTFGPWLLRGANASWLFPGEGGQPKHPLLFGKQITERIQKAIGLRITPHQFRHAAAAIYLKHHPGDYETVRRLLGHRNIQTTVRFYCGLETMQATEHFGKIIRHQIEIAIPTDSDDQLKPDTAARKAGASATAQSLAGRGSQRMASGLPACSSP